MEIDLNYGIINKAYFFVFCVVFAIHFDWNDRKNKSKTTITTAPTMLHNYQTPKQFILLYTQVY